MNEIHLLECKCSDKIPIDNFNINEKRLNYITKNWSTNINHNQHRIQMRKIQTKFSFFIYKNFFHLIILYAYKINTSN